MKLLVAHKPLPILLTAFVLLLAFATATVMAQDSEPAVPALEELKQEAMMFRQNILTATRDERQALSEEADRVLAMFDRRITALEQGIAERRETMPDAAQRYASELLGTLENQRENVSRLMGEVGSATDDAWSQAVYRFSSAYGAFFETWENVEANFGLDQ